MNNRVKQAIYLFLICFSAMAAIASAADAPDSCEYKILLNVDKSAESTCEKISEIVKKTAAKHGFVAKHENKDLPEREICFYDSATYEVNKKSFLLRTRKEGDKTEMTLKFRAPDLESALVAPVTPAPDYKGGVSTETDMVVKMGKLTAIYSASGKIKNLEKIPGNTDELPKYFPGLKEVGIKANQPLGIVNRLKIKEKRLLPGILDFGFDSSKSIFSVWYNAASGKAMVAEFSFTVKTPGYSGSSFSDKRKKVEAFFTDLIKQCEPYISSQPTKTGMVYNATQN